MRITFSIAVLSIAFAGFLDAAEPKPEKYWSEYHRGMKEPSLESAKVGDSDFQFRWTRLDSSHDPMVVRVWREHGKTRCRCVRLKYRLDFSVGPIRIDRTIPLTDEQTTQLRTLIASDGFWSPLSDQEQATYDGLLGGAHWLLEARDASGYRFLSMFSPVLVAFDHDLSVKCRDQRVYIDTANFLLKATRLFPDQTEGTSY